jgi:hypothetical protein
MELHWTDIITPGLTIIAFQTSLATSFRIADRQKWCPPCNKICAAFGFAEVSFLREDSTHFIEQPDFMA